MNEQELRAAERVCRIKAGTPFREVYGDCGDFEAARLCQSDERLLLQWAVQRLTATLPDDLEDEMYSASVRIVDCVMSRFKETLPPLVTELVFEDVEAILRPLLQRAAGVRAEKRGLGGRRLCPKCGTEEGVHGGCSCGELRAWSSADAGADGDHAIGIGEEEL